MSNTDITIPSESLALRWEGREELEQRIGVLESNIDSMNAIINNIQEQLERYEIYKTPTNVTTVNYFSKLSDNTND